MLHWPSSWPRTAPENRSAAYLGIERARAEQGLIACLGQMGALSVDLTCNPMWRDAQGLVRMPADPGVAVWCQGENGAQYVLACDTYMTVRDNITALFMLVDGIRQAALRGAELAALKMFEGVRTTEYHGQYTIRQEPPPPPPNESGAQWWQLFGFPMREAADLAACEKKYRTMVKKIHPDKPDGDAEAMRIWTEAIQQARKHFDS